MKKLAIVLVAIMVLSSCEKEESSSKQATVIDNVIELEFQSIVVFDGETGMYQGGNYLFRIEDSEGYMKFSKEGFLVQDTIKFKTTGATGDLVTMKVSVNGDYESIYSTCISSDNAVNESISANDNNYSRSIEFVL